jgi:hypothetical protein
MNLCKMNFYEMNNIINLLYKVNSFLYAFTLFQIYINKII